MKNTPQRSTRFAHVCALASVLSACAPTATPDGSQGDASVDQTSDVVNDSAPVGLDAATDVINEPFQCTANGSSFTFVPGEFYFDGCNACFCYPERGVLCLSRACVDAGPPPPFASTDAGMCAAQVRQRQSIEFEVRYPCGIPGGPVGVRDARCQSLCEPVGAGSPTMSTYKCSRTAEANVILCLRDYSGTGT